jgi:hypothetical protein
MGSRSSLFFDRDLDPPRWLHPQEQCRAKARKALVLYLNSIFRMEKNQAKDAGQSRESNRQTADLD